MIYTCRLTNWQSYFVPIIMAMSLLVWCIVILMSCDGINTTEMTFLETKILLMKRSMAIQNDRIKYLEKKEVMQDRKIENLKEEIYRLRPDIKSFKRSINSMMKIWMKNRRRMVRDYPPNMRSDSSKHNSIVQREVGIERMYFLLLCCI